MSTATKKMARANVLKQSALQAASVFNNGFSDYDPPRTVSVRDGTNDRRSFAEFDRIVDLYMEAVNSYKQRNGFADDELVNHSKRAALILGAMKSAKFSVIFQFSDEYKCSRQNDCENCDHHKDCSYEIIGALMAMHTVLAFAEISLDPNKFQNDEDEEPNEYTRAVSDFLTCIHRHIIGDFDASDEWLGLHLEMFKKFV